MPVRTQPRRGARFARGRAFTLIEVLVVVGVVGLLLAIILPAFSRARETARRAVCVSHMKQIGVAVFGYAGVNEDTAPPIMEPMGTVAPRVLLSRPGSLVNLGMLLDDELADARVFFCPSQTEYSFNRRLEQLGRAYIGGSYTYAVNLPAGKSTKVGAVRHLALITDDFVARRGSKWGNGHFAHREGYNVLYTDGSASWYANESESIARRTVYWDDETDDFTYDTFYRSGSPPPDPGGYGDKSDIFRVWHAFCYSLPDPFP
jgi:prepilin-type N-terminal cleavage/methylation domain-containing protein